MDSREVRTPIKDTGWNDGDESVAVKFFLAEDSPEACGAFAPGKAVNVHVFQNVCDTYPPRGICAADAMRVVGESHEIENPVRKLLYLAELLHSLDPQDDPSPPPK